VANLARIPRSGEAEQPSADEAGSETELP